MPDDKRPATTTTKVPGASAGKAKPSAWARLGGGLLLGATAGLIIKDLNLPSLVSYWQPRAPLVVAMTLLFGLLCLTRLRSLLVAATVALGLLWMLAAFTPVSSYLIKRVVRTDPIADADAIFVFSSNLQADGDPTPSDMTRLLHGFELLAEHRAPRLIVSELPAPHDRQEALARAWLPHFNTKAEIVAVGPVRSTRDEAVAVARLCRERGWKRVIAVSSPTHERRAAASLEHESLEVIASPCVETLFDLEHPDISDDRIHAFIAAMHDWIGYWTYRLRGWV